jgi:hypothetical protein
MHWRTLSLEEQSVREADAFSRVEKERREKKARAKAYFI